MKVRQVPILLAMLAVLSTTGCGAGASHDEAGTSCGALLRFADTTFRPIGTQQTPVRGEPLGRAGYLGCGESPVPEAGKVAVFAIAGVDHNQAVIAAQNNEGGDAVYVATDTPESDWPGVVTTAAHILRCTKPMTFQGSWDFIFTDTVPGDELYDIDVPYLAEFTARAGDHIDPNTWASVTIQARVTEDTAPVPSAGTAKAAIKDHEPVTVSTVCRGDAFEVTHLELSG